MASAEVAAAPAAGQQQPPAAGPSGGAIVAVGEVQSSAPTPAATDVVDTHTKGVGLIVPPHAIRVIVDKTADFVAKNGAPILPCTVRAAPSQPWPGQASLSARFTPAPRATLN